MTTSVTAVYHLQNLDFGAQIWGFLGAKSSSRVKYDLSSFNFALSPTETEYKVFLDVFTKWIYCLSKIMMIYLATWQNDN